MQPQIQTIKKLAQENIIKFSLLIGVIAFLAFLLRPKPEQNTGSRREEIINTPQQQLPESDFRKTRSSSAAKEDTRIPKIDSKDVVKTLQEIMTQDVADFKWITAGRKLAGCEEALLSRSCPDEVKTQANRLLDLPVMNTIRERYQQGFAVSQDMNVGVNWKFFKESKDGAKVSSKYSDDGNLWIKLDGIVNCRPESCASVWKEGSLYHHWFPHVQYSKILHSYTDTEIVLIFSGANPIGESEAIVHAWAINQFEEGYFLILGKSVKEYNNGVKVPKKKFMTRRTQVNALQIMVEPISETQTRICMIQSIAMPIPLPRSFLEWVLGHVFLDLLAAMTRTAQKNEQKGVEGAHKAMIKSDPFYSETFVPEVRKLFHDRNICENYKSCYFDDDE